MFYDPSNATIVKSRLLSSWASLLKNVSPVDYFSSIDMSKANIATSSEEETFRAKLALRLYFT